MQIYNYTFKNTDNEEINLAAHKGKVMLLVNTASKCGFTHQYEGLENLYQDYNKQGLEVVGFPCNQFLEQEPEDNAAIKSFCQVNYGVSFELSEKLEVRGDNAHPLFQYLTTQKKFEGYDLETEYGQKMQNFLSENLPHLLEGDEIKWNFTKFLISKEGQVVKRYESTIDPSVIKADIEALL